MGLDLRKTYYNTRRIDLLSLSLLEQHVVVRRFSYLQQSAVGRTDVSEGFVVDGGDEQRGEQRVSHLPVEQVHSVTWLRHQSGLISAAHIMLHALF